jgi:hypothetical protein
MKELHTPLITEFIEDTGKSMLEGWVQIGSPKGF